MPEYTKKGILCQGERGKRRGIEYPEESTNRSADSSGQRASGPVWERAGRYVLMTDQTFNLSLYFINLYWNKEDIFGFGNLSCPIRY
jgi:hypothetical protein